jgi:hypothetical protein
MVETLRCGVRTVRRAVPTFNLIYHLNFDFVEKPKLCARLVIMNPRLFERFTAMIDNIPAKGVVRAAELECQMLQSDMARKRTLPIEDVRSILAFCAFLKKATCSARASICVLPMQHRGFYRKTVERLIEAGELSSEAREQFDETFSPGFARALNA